MAVLGAKTMKELNVHFASFFDSSDDWVIVCQNMGDEPIVVGSTFGKATVRKIKVLSEEREMLHPLEYGSVYFSEQLPFTLKESL